MGTKVRIDKVEGEIVHLSDGSRVKVSSFDAGDIKWWSFTDTIEKDFLYLTNVTKGKKVSIRSA
jgi:hypothetical protein